MEKPAKKKFRITESDFLLANRKASREEELERHGKQIIFRTSTQKSKKVYDRKRLKRADIKNYDDLSFWFISNLPFHNWDVYEEQDQKLSLVGFPIWRTHHSISLSNHPLRSQISCRIH